MFKLELTAHDALWLGKVLIEYIVDEDKDNTSAVAEIWNMLRASLEQGAK